MIFDDRKAARRLSHRAALALFASPLALAPVFAATAHAGESAGESTGDAAVPASAGDTAGEIVVTATKRSESLQTVPISITAMTAQQLEQHQVAGFDDYAKLLPSVSYQSFGPGQSQLYFRGITNGGDGIASGPLPAAGVYVDETPVTTIFGSVDMHIYDVARVEALAGPQGTLYGASSLSGTLRIITNQPKLGKWEGGLDGEFNKFGPGSAGGKAEGFINIPIGDRAALRISGYYEHDGGYISNVPGTRTYQRQYTSGYDSGDNPIYATDPMNVSNSKYVAKNFNQVDQAGGRAALRVELDDNWTVTPAVYYQHQTAGGTFLYGPEGYSPGNGTPALGDLQVHDFTPDHDRDDWYLASLTIQGKLSDWDVTYSGSYFDRRVDTVADYSYYTVAYDQLYPDYTHFTDANGKAIDPTQVVDTYNKYTKFSQELRISSPAHNPWRLTAGLFMQRQTDRFIANYEIPGLSGSQEGGAVYGDDIFYSNLNRVDRDYAAFAEGSYDITRNVTLTAGIRGFIADNTLFGWSGGAGTLSKVAATNNCTGNVTVFSCPDVNSKYVGSGETHKASLKWQVNHNAMVYFTYSTGFRPGGNNRVTYFYGYTQNPGPYKADTLTNYELGWKTTLFDKRLRFNGAIFWEDWNNVQYAQPGIQGVIFTLNAGSARSRGIEGDVSWRVARGLTVSASGTYVDAKLTQDFICPLADGCGNVAYGGLFAAKGTKLPITPSVKLNATARYEFAVGRAKAFLQGSLNSQSSTANSLRNDWQAILGSNKGFTTVDFSGGWTKDNLSFTLFINNAFDERGVLSKNLACSASPCLSYARSYPTKPQQFGIRSSIRF